jgi:hypothetical protein
MGRKAQQLEEMSGMVRTDSRYLKTRFSVKDNGIRVAVDDPRLDPIWQKCAE